MKYFALLTKLGENLLAQATALGTKLELTHMAVGDGGGKLPTPDANQTKLIKEQRRAAINTLFIDEQNKNQIIAEQIIPENEGGWWVREIGLFDKAGNLIAVANSPETYKPKLVEGSGRTLAVRIVLIVSHTDAVTLQVDPSVVLVTREYVDSQITIIDKKLKTLSDQIKLDLLKKFDKENISSVLGNDNNKVPSLHLLATEIGKLQPKGNYAPAGDYATNALLTDGLALKLDKENVVQGTGTSTKQVMSQDAITKALQNANKNAESKVPKTTKVNGKELSQDITLDSVDIYKGFKSATGDLNKIVAAGLYTSFNHGDAKLANNFPIEDRGVLTVKYINLNIDTVVQEYHSYSNRLFIRTSGDYAKSWTPWKEIGTANNRIEGFRLGTKTRYTPKGNTISWNWEAPEGNVLTGLVIDDTGNNSADNVSGAWYRPLQYFINNQWVTASSL